jgi:hypothetical protein
LGEANFYYDRFATGQGCGQDFPDRHLPDWQEVENFICQIRKQLKIGIGRSRGGKKTRTSMDDGFLCLLTKPEFHLHLINYQQIFIISHGETISRSR